MPCASDVEVVIVGKPVVGEELPEQGEEEDDRCGNPEANALSGYFHGRVTPLHSSTADSGL